MDLEDEFQEFPSTMDLDKLLHGSISSHLSQIQTVELSASTSPWSDDEPPSALSPPRRHIAWGRFAPGFCGAALAIVIGLSWSIAAFGSINHAWLYANGVRLIIDNPSVQLPDGKPGDDRDAEFLVHNLSAQPIHILGVTTSCGCVSTDKLPATVPPQGIKALRLAIHLERSATGAVQQTVIYHTDEPTAPNLAVKVSGRVIDP